MGNPLPVHLHQECAKAIKILNGFVDPVNGLDKIVPLSVLQKAKGFAIFSVFRIGFVMSARAGSGIVIAKLDDEKWTAPAAIGIGGLGGGLNIGAEVTDFLVILNSKSAVRSFMATGSLQLGGNLSVAVGPLGRSAEASGSVNTKGKMAAMFSYSKSRGLYGGVSLEGTILVDREDANAKAYGQHGTTAKQILSGSVPVPGFADILIDTIQRFMLSNSPFVDADSNSYRESHSYYNRSHRKSDASDKASINSTEMRTLATDSTARNASAASRRSQARSKPSADLDDFDDLNLSDRDGKKRLDQGHQRDRRRRGGKEDDDDDDEEKSNNPGLYAFSSSVASVSSTPPPRSDSASGSKSRPGIRQRSSSIASNLSFGSFGKKKLERLNANPTPPPDSNEKKTPRRASLYNYGDSTASWLNNPSEVDGLDPLDRELQGINHPSHGSLIKPVHLTKSSSYAGTSLPHQPNVSTSGGGHSVTGRQAWSTFSSNPNNHKGDDVFDGPLFNHIVPLNPTNPTHDPFAELTSDQWIGSSSSSSSATVPFRSNSASPAFPSHTFSRSKQRSTPTISETIEPEPESNLIDFNIEPETVIALYDFQAQQKGDLGFEKGQIIKVIKKTNNRDDWWQGEISSKLGIFPANYTEPI